MLYGFESHFIQDYIMSVCTIHGRLETCNTSFDPCVVNHVGFLLSACYHVSWNHVVLLCRTASLLNFSAKTTA